MAVMVGGGSKTPPPRDLPSPASITTRPHHLSTHHPVSMQSPGGGATQTVPSTFGAPDVEKTMHFEVWLDTPGFVGSPLG